MKNTKATPAERTARFWSKVDMSGKCWMWEGTVDHGGYGQFWDGRTNRRAHRVAYEWLVGPIPPGLQIDHLCRQRACVNPAHMEPTTPKVNTMRSTAVTAENAAKTHCHKGHEFTPDNTYVNPRHGGRTCKTCRRDWDRKRRAR